MWYLLFLFVVVVNGQYDVPDAKIEVFSPRGFTVSIPDEPGIKLFAFHGKINEEFEGKESGTIARDVIKAKNGSWTFVDKETKLKVGDVLYYWMYVIYNNGKSELGYEKHDQKFVVEELINPNLPKIDIRNMGNSDSLFYDSFSSDVLNTNLWTVEQKFGDQPDYEFVMYINNPRTLSISNNKLKIQPVLSTEIYGENFIRSTDGFDFREKCTGVINTAECRKRAEAGFILPPVASAQISTKNKFSFKYGKIEIRAKIPCGDWIYPEIYLNPAQEIYGSKNYESGQIRVAFAPGNNHLNKVLHGGVVLGQSNAARTYGDRTIEDMGKNWSDDFHTYALNWQPDGIILSVDNKVYGRIDPPANGFSSLKSSLNIRHADRWRTGSKMSPFDQEMYLVVGVGVGGFNFKDCPNKPWTNGERNMVERFLNAKDQWYSSWTTCRTMEVDYIKVTKN